MSTDTKNAIQRAINDNYSIIVYRNGLGTTTVALLTSDVWGEIQVGLDNVPEDRIVDTADMLTPDVLEETVALVIRKMRREGEYHDWDEKMAKLFKREA